MLLLNLAVWRQLLLGVLLVSGEVGRAVGQAAPDPPVGASWSREHHDTGLHFRHAGSLVGSLQFGHLRFDLDLREVAHQLM